jgi:F0F1-type ATP synthase assembly protein I
MSKRDPSALGSVGKYIGSALVLPIATAVGFGIGYGLDALFHTGWLRFVFLVLGTIAGFIELVRDLWI